MCVPLHNLTFNSPIHEHVVLALLYVLSLWGCDTVFPAVFILTTCHTEEKCLLNEWTKHSWECPIQTLYPPRNLEQRRTTCWKSSGQPPGCRE